LTLELELTEGPTQTCPGAACSAVTHVCDVVLDVRVSRPSDRRAPFISYCDEVTPNRKRDLCALAAVELPTRDDLPRETLEVQVLLWPRGSVKRDPDTGRYDCSQINGEPTAIEFDLNGFPRETAPAPALGGHAYFRPGDARTVVTLGCSNLASLRAPVCATEDVLDASAIVSAFSGVITPSVVPQVATRLDVAVGEPKYVESEGVFSLAGEKTALDRDGSALPPQWRRVIRGAAVRAITCIEVEDQEPGARIPVLQCSRTTPGSSPLTLPGLWISRNRLEAIGRSVTTPLPGLGITLGIVVDQDGRPVQGATVAASGAADVKFLNATGDAVLETATSTTSSGLFIESAATFGTELTASRPGKTATGVGGRVAGAITAVVLRLGP
jgi:hypothetical protein